MREALKPRIKSLLNLNKSLIKMRKKTDLDDRAALHLFWLPTHPLSFSFLLFPLAQSESLQSLFRFVGFFFCFADADDAERFARGFRSPMIVTFGADFGGGGGLATQFSTCARYLE